MKAALIGTLTIAAGPTRGSLADLVSKVELVAAPRHSSTVPQDLPRPSYPREIPELPPEPFYVTKSRPKRGRR